MYITNSSGTQAYYSVSKDVVVLAGETQTHQLHFTDLIADGDYLIRAYVSMHNGWGIAMKDEDGNHTFDITIGEGGSTSTPILSLYKSSEINKSSFYYGDELTYKAYINNTGDIDTVYLSIDIMDENGGWLYCLFEDNYYLSSGYNEISLSGFLNNDTLPSGNYYVNIWNVINNDNYGWMKPSSYNACPFYYNGQRNEQELNLEMVDVMQLNKTSFYPGERIEAAFTLKNLGDAGYVNVGFTLVNTESETWYPMLGEGLINTYLSANSTKDFNFTIDIPDDYTVGTYAVLAYYELGGSFYNIESTENSIMNITIKEFDGKYEIMVTSKNDNGETLGSGRYEYGSEVTIAAIPDYGYRFYRWSDKNKENPRVITVEGDVTYEAEFRAITISLEAQPNDDAFEFVEWSDGETDNPRTISIVEEDELEYVAIFRMKETAIENAYITSAHVYSNSGSLYVIGAENDYLVFDEVGKLIYSGSENSIQLPSGVYLVRLGKEVQKVVVL